MRWLTILLAALTFAIYHAAPAQAAQLKNVAVSRVEPGGALLVVKTDDASDATVDYGFAPGAYTLTAASSGQQRHEISLANLPPGARIYYRVTIADSADPSRVDAYPEKSFSAFKPARQPFRFIVGGDNRPDFPSPVMPPPQWRQIISQMAGEQPDLALHVGDSILAQGNDTVAANMEKYDAYFSATTDLTWTAPFYMSAGNHELLDTKVGMAGYRAEFTLPENNGPDAALNGELYYSFDYGDTHFIVLCTEIPGEAGMITGNQMLWLEGDLAADNMPWKVVVLHRPLFGRSGTLTHLADPWFNPLNAAGRQNHDDLVSLLKRYGVDIIFTGHDHYYLHHREDGIQYVTTAGGGAPLYEPPAPGPDDIYSAREFHHVRVDETADSMTVSAIDIDGSEMESFTLGEPSIGLAAGSPYWGSFADARARRVSIDYELRNQGHGDALDVTVTANVTSGGVSPATLLPAAAAGLRAGASRTLTIKYQVPAGVPGFRAVMATACDGLDGVHRSFPG